MHIAVVTLPGYGHINPTLRTARELIARNHDVEYYLPERFADVVESTGATFQRLSDALDILANAREHGFQPGMSDEREQEQKQDREKGEQMSQTMMGNADAESEVVDRIAASDPDVIVFDPMCLWGREAVDQLDVPSVGFYTSFALREGSPLLDDLSSGPPGPSRPGLPGAGPTEDDSLPDPLANALEARGISDPNLADFLGATVDADLSIVPIPQSFQPDADEFGDDYRFVGPMIRSGVEEQEGEADLPLDRFTNRKSVYVSLGTVVHGNRAFFEACFDAFGDTDWEIVIKSKENADKLDSESPENVSVRRRVPQLDLLERIDVFVTHGGMNLTMEALSSGTPLVVIPQGGDQHVVAERITDLGLGSVLDPETLTAADLADAVETVHSDSYHEVVESFQTILREAGGAERVADAIEQFDGHTS
jgi:MGT family glycosyltransferase